MTNRTTGKSGNTNLWSGWWCQRQQINASFCFDYSLICIFSWALTAPSTMCTSYRNKLIHIQLNLDSFKKSRLVHSVSKTNIGDRGHLGFEHLYIFEESPVDFSLQFIFFVHEAIERALMCYFLTAWVQNTDENCSFSSSWEPGLDFNLVDSSSITSLHSLLHAVEKLPKTLGSSRQPRFHGQILSVFVLFVYQSRESSHWTQS